MELFNLQWNCLLSIFELMSTSGSVDNSVLSASSNTNNANAGDLSGVPENTRDSPSESYYDDLMHGKKFHVSGHARTDLVKWCSMPWEDPPFHYTSSGIAMSDAWTYMILLGGTERVSALVGEYRLNSSPDGKGELDEEMLETHRDDVNQIIEQTLNFLINAGVVGALLLSVLFPVALTPLVPSDESVLFFGDNLTYGILITYFVFVYSSLFFSLWITFMTIHYYLHITLWMPTLELKLWYCNDLNTLPAVVVITHSCVLAAAFSLPFGIGLAITPEAGLIALILDLLMLGSMAFNIFSPNGGDAMIIKELHSKLQKMLLNDGVIKGVE